MIGGSGARYLLLFLSIHVKTAPISVARLPKMISGRMHPPRILLIRQPKNTPGIAAGVKAGRMVSNILGGCILPDIIFGSLATLIGAIFTWMLRNKSKYLAPLPPIIANVIVVPFVLKYGYMVPLPIPFMMLTVGIGEVISCGVLGLILYTALNRYRGLLFKTTV